ITRVSALYPLDDEWIVTMLLADYITNVFQFGVVSWAYIKIYDDPMFSKMTQTIGDMYLAGLAYLVTTGVLDPAEVAKFIY
ncbi:MAG: hypothetical protein OEZ10_14115, partial [Gammaproteobacteria bacterium]|nr:hypothetical protein [Gammaproteobacteria bacterium]